MNIRRLGHLTGPRERAHAYKAAIASISLYAVFALCANWPAWPGNGSLFRPGDATGVVWDLEWIPFCLLHGHNPFYTTWINAPVGANFAQDLAMPLLSLLLSPVTFVGGPIIALNTLMWLSYLCSAAAMYFVLRKWAIRPIAAFVGGLLYGFNPYMVGQGYAHIQLIFVPIPPVFLYLLVKLVTQRTQHPLRIGASLGLLLAAQYYIFSELAFTLCLLLVPGLIVVALRSPRAIMPTLRFSALAVCTSAGVFILLIAYSIWTANKGPYRYIGSVHPVISGGYNGLEADLFSSVLPTSFIKFAPASWKLHADLFTGQDYPEVGSYLGGPLLVFLCVAFRSMRKNRWAQLCVFMILVSFIMSLGPSLIINNHDYGAFLPYKYLLRLPYMTIIEASRISFEEYAFIAIFVALTVHSWLERGVAGRSHSPGVLRAHLSQPSRLQACAVSLLGIFSLVALIPAWPFPSYPTAVPSFFESNLVDKIPFGSEVLMSPYPSVAELAPQLFQAEASMRFKIIGGYGYFPTAKGVASTYPTTLQPLSVETWLWYQVADGVPPGYPAIPKVNSHFLSLVREFLVRNGVQAVIWTDVGTNPQAVLSVFTAVLGKAPIDSGGVEAWPRINLRH